MKQIKSVFIAMWRYAKSVLIGKIAIVVAMSVLVPINALLLQNLVDCMVGLLAHTRPWQDVLLWTVLLCGFVLLEVILTALSQLLDVKCDQKLVDNMESVLLEKFRRLAYVNYEDKDTQNLIHRMSDQPYMRIKNLFLQLLSAMQIVITLIGLTAVYAKVSPALAVFTFVLVIPMIWASCGASRLWWDLYARQSGEERQLEYLDDMLSSKSALFELKVYRSLRYIVRLWNKKTKQMMEQKLKVQKQSQKRIHLQSLLSVIWYGSFIMVMLAAFLGGNITLGLFVSLLGISLPAINTLTDLAGNVGLLAREIMEMDYYQRFMELPEFSDPKDYEGDILPEIVFEKVTFTYPNSSAPVLRDVSFCIHSKESVGIVGVNGAGKSTIIKLLCKFYEPNSGRILIGGIDIKRLSYQNIRTLFSAVFQDFFRYELTLRDNLALGNLSKRNDDEALWQAMQRCGLAGLCERGLDTNLGKLEADGIDLSGGQWQRLAISRAYLSEAPFIILDEPTASLDPVAESEMYALFFHVMKEKGAIMISHRLASSKMADKILVLDHGMIYENGTHEQLMRKKGRYYEMYTEQASWYAGEGDDRK